MLSDSEPPERFSGDYAGAVEEAHPSLAVTPLVSLSTELATFET